MLWLKAAEAELKAFPKYLMERCAQKAREKEVQVTAKRRRSSLQRSAHFDHVSSQLPRLELTGRFLGF